MGRCLDKWKLQLKTRAGTAPVGVRMRFLSGPRITGQTLRPTHFKPSRVALFCDQRLMEVQ